MKWVGIVHAVMRAALTASHLTEQGQWRLALRLMNQ